MRFEDWASGRQTISLPVHQSHVKCASHCRRKMFWRYRMGLVPTYFVPGDAVRNGKFVHVLLANFFLRRPDGEGLAEASAMGEDYVQRWMETPGGIGKTADDLRRDLAKDLALAKAMFDVFKGLPDVQKIPEQYEIVEVEREMKAKAEMLKPPRTPGAGLRMTVELEGTLDLLLRDRKTGNLWVWDHKTLDANGSIERYKDTSLMDPQTWVYRELANAWAHEHIDSGQSVGVVYCILKRPTIRQTMKETYDDYLGRVKTWYRAEGKYEDKAADWAKDPPMSAWRQPIHPKTPIPEDIQRVISETAVLATTDQWDRFPRATPDACFDFMRWCEYLPLCKAEVSDYDRIIHNTYRITNNGRD